MNSQSYILSIPGNLEQKPAEWLQKIKEYCTRLSSQGIPVNAVEWRAQREQCNGHFPDNPSIDSINKVLELMEETDLMIDTLLIPCDVSKPEDKLGQELSTINGWCDLSGYVGCNCMRLQLTTPVDFYNPVVEETINNVLAYASDQELQISISAPAAILPNLRDYIHRVEDQFDVGLDFSLPANSIERVSGDFLAEKNIRTLCIYGKEYEINHFIPACLELHQKQCPDSLCVMSIDM